MQKIRFSRTLIHLVERWSSHLPLSRFHDLPLLSFCATCLIAATVSAASHAAELQRREDQALAAVIAFAGLTTGNKVAHFLPASDDYANVFCKAVGESGHIYAISAPLAGETNTPIAAASKHCSNVTATILKSRNFPAPELYDSVGDPGAVYEYYASRLPVESFVAPEPLDVIWIADRYHELHSKTFGTVNLAYVNAALLKALKPSGVLIVEDYSAKQGAGARDTATLHRIDAELVRKEVVDVGFEFVGESDALHEAQRFLLKFKKP